MLEARNLTASYGRHRALDGVTAHVDVREICVVLGANGAGKTTLLKAIGGIVPVNGNTDITMNGRCLKGLKAHEIVEAGIALVPEGRGIFADLTVEENLQLGAYAARARSHEAHNREMVFDLFPRLAERRRQLARTMSGGEQQMVAIGRALMSDPEILMLDEPSLGLSPLLCSDLFKSLKEIGRTGVGILLVEQNAKLSLAIADRGYLLENGHIIGHDSAANLISDPAVQRAYLGGGDTRQALPAGRDRGPVRPTGYAPADDEMAAGLAARAAKIQASHIIELRHTGPVPSAFRHLKETDMRAIRTPPPPGGAALPDAAQLSRMAGHLAAEAAAIHSAHIEARRAAAAARSVRTEAPPALQSPPSPPSAQPPAQLPADAGELSRMAGDLAARAGAIHAAHIAARRAGLEMPPVGAPETGKPGKAKRKKGGKRAKQRLCDKDPSKVCTCSKAAEEKRHKKKKSGKKKHKSK